MLARSAPEVFVSGYDSPEGPAFDRNGNLFFVLWTKSSIMKVDPAGNASEFANTGGMPVGLAFHRDGTLYVADQGDNIHGVLRITPEGEILTFVNSFQGRALNGSNDLVFDPDGILYFSDPCGSSVERPIGAFYRAFPDGRLELIDGGLAFPNGVALNSDASAIFVAETYKNRILRYEIMSDHRIGERTIFAAMDGSAGPDGMDFDAEGNLYVAHFGAQHVDILNPSGNIIECIVLPGKKPTNVEWGGPDFDTLFVTEVETGSIYTILMNVKGQRHFADQRR